MLRPRLRYGILLIAAGILYIFYYGYTSWFLFTLVLLLPLCTFVLFWISSHRCQIQISTTHHPSQSEGISLRLTVHSQSFFPACWISMLIQISNRFAPEDQKREVHMGTSMTSQTLTIPLVAEHIGIYTLRFSPCFAYDLLGIFRRSLSCPKSQSVLVLPNPNDAAIAMPETIPTEDGEGGALTKTGTDDFSGVRPYQPQDSPSRIHWKISVRTDEWMVKETSASLQAKSALYCDLAISLSQQEAMITNLYALSQHLLAHHHTHDIVAMNHGKIIHRITVGNEEDLIRAMEILYQFNDVIKDLGNVKCDLPGFCIHPDGITVMSGKEENDETASN